MTELGAKEAGEGLRVRGLSVWHPGRPPVVLEVDFDAQRGRITAVLGPNGAGKSTLLRGLLGLAPYSGEVRLDGVDLSTLEVVERARLLAYVPQRSGLRVGLRARSVVEQGRFAHRGAWGDLSRKDHEAVSHAMAQTGTTELESRRFSELSGGERQRVLTARALATGARTLLLDEPTSSLDVRQVLLLHRVLRSLAEQNYLILVVVHDLSEARQHCDHAFLLREGRLAGDVSMAEAVTSGRVSEVFGVELVEGGGLGYRVGGEPE